MAEGLDKSRRGWSELDKRMLLIYVRTSIALVRGPPPEWPLVLEDDGDDADDDDDGGGDCGRGNSDAVSRQPRDSILREV